MLIKLCCQHSFTNHTLYSTINSAPWSLRKEKNQKQSGVYVFLTLRRGCTSNAANDKISMIKMHEQGIYNLYGLEDRKISLKQGALSRPSYKTTWSSVISDNSLFWVTKEVESSNHAVQADAQEVQSYFNCNVILSSAFLFKWIPECSHGAFFIAV